MSPLDKALCCAFACGFLAFPFVGLVLLSATTWLRARRVSRDAVAESFTRAKREAQS